MPILDRSKKKELDRYLEFVRNSEFGNVTQDISWAAVKKDWVSEQVYVLRAGEIVAAMTLLVRRGFGRYSMIYATRGPVCDIYDTALVTELIKEVDLLAKKYHAFLLRFDPEAVYDKQLEQLYRKMGFQVRNYGYDKDELIQPRYNMILDLKDQTEETLMNKFSSKTRYNIRLSQKKGVTARFSREDEDVKAFYEIYLTMTDRQKIGKRTLEYFFSMRDAFENLRIYITEHEGDLLSAAVAVNYGGKVWYAYGGSTNTKRNLMPNYLMQWEMIKWGLETGATKYDFGGVFELNLEDGLYRFKEGFCNTDGVTEFIGEIDRIYMPTIYFLFDKAVPFLKKAKRWLRNVTKKIHK